MILFLGPYNNRNLQSPTHKLAIHIRCYPLGFGLRYLKLFDDLQQENTQWKVTHEAFGVRLYSFKTLPSPNIFPFEDAT